MVIQFYLAFFFAFFTTVEYFSIFIKTASGGDKNQRFLFFRSWSKKRRYNSCKIHSSFCDIFFDGGSV